jgi:hypothetical protein
MAIALRAGFENLTLTDYDAILEAMNFPADWPDGLLAHASMEIDGKLVVHDAWESRAQFDAFVADRLGPALGQALGDRAEQPQLIERELHTMFTP